MSGVTRPESLSTRVRRGVALLDEKVPGWHNRIDVEKLDVRFCTTCIVGQLFSDGFWMPLQTLVGRRRVGYDDSRGFGFDVDPFEHDYKVLNRLWAYVVRQRQAAAFFAHPDVNGDGFDLVYAIAANGDVWCWSERYGWRKSVFGNLNGDSDFDRAHFADHLDRITVAELPVGAR